MNDNLYRLILLPFMAVSAAGTCAVIVFYLIAVTGSEPPVNSGLLFSGMFVPWIVAVMAAQRLSRNTPPREMWKSTLRGCPPWMVFVTKIFIGLALANFLAAMLGFWGAKSAGHQSSSRETMLMGGGHMLIFYWLGFCILYSAYAVGWAGMIRRCVNGHEISPGAKFCAECGASVSNA